MNQQIPIITKVEFFDTSYMPRKASVSARSYSSLTWRKSGRVLVACNENELISEPNMLTFVPAGCSYFTEILEAGEMFALHYQIADGCKDFFDRPTLIQPTNRDRFFDIFSRALSHSAVRNECACMADAYRLFSEIFKETCLQGIQPPPSIAIIKQYMDESFTSSELRISDLAQRHKTSEAYFRREFKKYYGESPLSYIKRRRIELACRLLSTELYSITDVALRAGFDSVSYFSLEFKRLMGCSPREYKNM